MATEQQYANGALSDAEWEALCHDIGDRRGLKWEWEKIDDCVKLEIRAAWSKILAQRPASFTAEQIRAAARKTGCVIAAEKIIAVLYPPPKPKTPEERVRVTQDARWCRVFLDDVKVMCFEQQKYETEYGREARLHADTYAAGLREQIREEANRG